MKPSSLITQRNYFFLLLPFLYAFFSRMKGLRGFAFNAMTAWVPGILLVALHADSLDAWGAAVRYGLGYLAFISIYELGYLANDTWGLQKDETPRRRIAVDFSMLFVLLFVAGRLGLAFGLAVYLGVWGTSWFFGLLVATFLVIGLHNLVSVQSVKFETFIQMSAIRFSFPVLLASEAASAVVTVLVGLAFFALPRLFTYQYSKGRLNLPERSEVWYSLANVAAMLPLVLVIFSMSDQASVLVLWGYFLTFHATYFFTARESTGARILRSLGIIKAGDATD